MWDAKVHSLVVERLSLKVCKWGLVHARLNQVTWVEHRCSSQLDMTVHLVAPTFLIAIPPVLAELLVCCRAYLRLRRHKSHKTDVWQRHHRMRPCRAGNLSGEAAQAHTSNERNGE